MNKLAGDGVTEQERQWWCEKSTYFFLAIIVLLSWHKHGCTGQVRAQWQKESLQKGVKMNPKKKLGLLSRVWLGVRKENKSLVLFTPTKPDYRKQAKRLSQTEHAGL